MQHVRQILFVPPAPVVWATDLGVFEANGVAVETTPTLSSDQIGQGLADGTWDVGIGVVDNVLAWNADRQAGLAIVAQLERSQAMAFVGAPDIGSLADAARLPIGVDATTNGFVLVLYRALARAGIDRASCRFDPVGGVRKRFEALLSGRIASTILVPPFIDMALQKGCTTLFDGAEHAPAYPGVVAAARRAWLDAHHDAALGYLRALEGARAWAVDPANRDEAIAALVAIGYAEPAAVRLLDSTLPSLVPLRAGFDESIALRREAGALSGGAPAYAELVAVDLLALASPD